MTVAVDIGNTNIVVAAYDNGVWNKPFRVFTDTKKTGDEYYVIFSSLFDERGVDREKVDKVIISSVVPFFLLRKNSPNTSDHFVPSQINKVFFTVSNHICPTYCPL